jgi:hypothetical protein
VQKSAELEHKNSKREVPGSIRGAIRERPGSMPKIESLFNEDKRLIHIVLKSPENAYIRGIKKPFIIVS